MLYIKNTNFLFIHIPRTAGNAITRTLTKELVNYEDVTIATSSTKCLWRHMNAITAIKNLGIEKPKIVAISRKKEEIINSEFQMMRKSKREYNKKKHPELYRKREAAKKNDYGYFQDVWADFLQGKTIWEWWTNNLMVEPIPFNMLDEFWPRICELAGCRNIPKLEKWDWQLDRYLGLY